MSGVYISGVGMTRFGKRDEELITLLKDAALAALKDCKSLVPKTKIDAIFVGSMNTDEFAELSNLSAFIATELGLGSAGMRVETAMSSGAAAFHLAFFAIAAGQYENVLVLAGEKMTNLSNAKVTKILSHVIHPKERVYGATMPALAALVARRYMHDYNVTVEDLALVAMKNHSNGVLNPYAQFRQKLTFEQIMNSKIVASPLRLYDCAPISDGACAVVLGTKKTDIRVAGIGHATDAPAIAARENLTSFRATRLAAKRAYEMAGMNRKDIGVAELHDAFTHFELIDSEDVGFFGPGEGAKALRKGRTEIGGDLPINPSGGLKARGHPVGASGLAQIVELVWQLREEAEKRQVENATVGLAQSIGGMGANNLVTIVARCE